jgi:hypothetical protein
MRGGLVVRVLVSAALAGASLVRGNAAAQQDLRGDAIISYQLFGSDQLDSKGLHQIYDVNYQRNLTDPLRLRLSFRGEGNNGSTEIGLATTKLKFWQLQPGGEVSYTLPTIQLHGTYDLYDRRASVDDQQEDRNKLQRITGGISWTPDGLPSFNVFTDQRQQRDVLAGISEDDSSTVQSLSWTRPTFMVGETALYQTQDLNLTGFTRTVSGIQGQAQYQNSFWDGRLTANAYALGGVTRIEDQAGKQTASVPTQVVIPNAAVSHDETPSDSRDIPPLPSPALTDGNFTASAGVSLGPDGLSFQNIFLDLQRFTALDEFRVFVRDSGGNFVRVPGLIEWTVYTSINNLDWTPVPGLSSTGFITTQSAYDVTFPQTAARYFKIVSFGTNSVETLVTEIQAFFHTSFNAGETDRTDIRTLSATVTLTGKVTNWLTLSYYGNANDSHTSPTGKADYGSLDHDQIVTLEGKPTDKLTATLRYEYQRGEFGTTFSQTLSGYWATLQYNLTQHTSSSIEASHLSQKNDQDITTDTLRLHEYARLYNSLDVYVDAGVARQNYNTLDVQALQTFLTGYTYAQLTRSLRLNLSANYQVTRFEGSGALAQFGTLETHVGNYYAELYYRPSSKLLLSGRFGWVTGSRLSGATQTYRAEWYPFAGGTIGFGTIYDDDIETNGFEHRFRRIQFLPRWQINSHAILDLNYSYLTLRSFVPGLKTTTSTKQLYVNLTLTL